MDYLCAENGDFSFIVHADKHTDRQTETPLNVLLLRLSINNLQLLLLKLLFIFVRIMNEQNKQQQIRVDK